MLLVRFAYECEDGEVAIDELLSGSCGCWSWGTLLGGGVVECPLSLSTGSALGKDGR